jgi:exosortase E/protease (VPEID-CTERM system)
LVGRGGVAGQIGVWGAWILRGIIGFATAFVALAGIQGELAWADLSNRIDSDRLRWPLLYLHAAAMVGFAVASAALYGNWSGVAYPDALALAWIAAGLTGLVAGCTAFIPFSFLEWLKRSTGPVWIFSLAVSLLALAAVKLSQSLWQYAAEFTFHMVVWIVRPILPSIVLQPERLRMVGPNFGVIVNQECSGLEGAGLLLVFMTAWLILFRRDFRFPRSLVLIPACVAVLYIVNAFRIAALFLLGNAGAPTIAAGGFHSQAGWIAFNGVALAIAVIVPRIAWFRTRPREPRVVSAVATPNATAAYLMPFLMIIVAGMFSRAASADFEWFYGLRFATALAALWLFRDQLRKVDWRGGWIGVVAGIAVFGLWVGVDMLNGTPSSGMPKALAATTPAIRSLWIVLRFLAATTTVPIAEELAFRGFLMRRIQSEDFESISLNRVSWLSVVVSSVAFGLLHGSRWPAGIAAGFVYALAARRSNRLGEAILAHSVTNTLLAVFVLGQKQWQYW